MKKYFVDIYQSGCENELAGPFTSIEEAWNQCCDVSVNVKPYETTVERLSIDYFNVSLVEAYAESEDSEDYQAIYSVEDGYTQYEVELEAKLSEVANEEGIIQAGDMLQFTREPTMHTTMKVSSAFIRLTGKPYDTDFFCDELGKSPRPHHKGGGQ